jgi:hypothetical protein
MPSSRSPGSRRKRSSSTSKTSTRSSSRSSSRSPKTARKTVKKTPVKRCNKMPEHRIKNLIEFEKMSDAASNINRSPGYYEKLKPRLETLCFPKNAQWEKLGTLTTALYAANKN